QQSQVEGSPQLDQVMPVPLLLSVQLYSAVTVIPRQPWTILQRGTDNSLVIVGSRIEQVSEFLFRRPCGRCRLVLNFISRKLLQPGGDMIDKGAQQYQTLHFRAPIFAKNQKKTVTQSPACCMASVGAFSILTLAKRWPSISCTANQRPSSAT